MLVLQLPDRSINNPLRKNSFASGLKRFPQKNFLRTKVSGGKKENIKRKKKKKGKFPKNMSS